MSGRLPPAPRAARRTRRLTKHGHTRNDDYYWLRDREDAEVIDYLHAENAYCQAAMAATEPLQQALYDEIRGRIPQADQSAPYRDRDYWYYTRFEPDCEYPVYARRYRSMQAPEQVMLDVNVLAEGQDFLDVDGLAVSPDQHYLAYAVDRVGRRQYELRIVDLRSGLTLPVRAVDTSPGIAWAADSSGVLLVSNDPQTLRARSVYWLPLAGSVPQLLFDESDETFDVAVAETRSEQYLQIISSSTVSSEVSLLDARDPTGPAQLFCARSRDHEYHLDHDGDRFYVCSNLEAKNFRLLSAEAPGQPSDQWRPEIAHRDDVLLEDFTLFRDYLVLSQMRAGVTEIEIVERVSGERHLIHFDESAHCVDVAENCDYASTTLRFDYESMSTPASVFEYRMPDRGRECVHRDRVLQGYDPDRYASERMLVTARDGSEIPVSLVWRRDIEADDPRPLLLYAYGAYGHSMTPSFSYARPSLLDRGFIYAIAHVRGGSELGRDWYEQGKLALKQNTYNDYVDVARALVAQGRTAHDRLYAMGGSAGGLLMGVVINQAPDAFAGVVAAVPFVDVVSTMLDESIPLTTGEYDEWGNPNVAADYQTMLAYSPYDNVAAQHYPAMLVTAGLHDSQVQFWEPAKWVAKLRASKTDDHLLLLHTHMEAGHDGATGRFESIRETARNYSFLLMLEEGRSG